MYVCVQKRIKEWRKKRSFFCLLAYLPTYLSTYLPRGIHREREIYIYIYRNVKIKHSKRCGGKEGKKERREEEKKRRRVEKAFSPSLPLPPQSGS